MYYCEKCIQYFATMQHLGIFDILLKINLGIFDNFSKNNLYSVSDSNWLFTVFIRYNQIFVFRKAGAEQQAAAASRFLCLFVCLKFLDSEYNIFLKMVVL